jgi:dissimilatory sulfite reductase (desulfoviridin) alpha/beta subunit
MSKGVDVACCVMNNNDVGVMVVVGGKVGATMGVSVAFVSTMDEERGGVQPMGVGV